MRKEKEKKWQKKNRKKNSSPSSPPYLRRVRHDVVVVLPVPLPALGVRQRQRVPDRRGDVRHVPGVDQNRPGAERLRRAGKLGQHQHAGVVGLARHELVGDQVHAVAQRGHETDVCDRVEGREFGKAELAVEVVDGDVGQGAVVAVDPSDDLVDKTPQPAVLWHVGPARHRNLHQQHLVPPLRVLLQELLERQQLLRDALDDVEPVNAQHHLPSRIAVQQLRGVGSHVGPLQSRGEALRVDADGEGGDAGQGAGVLDSLRCPFQPQDAGAGGDEVPGVVVGVEPDEICLQHRAEHLLAHGQGAVDLGTREGRVQKPPDLHPRDAQFE